MAPQRPWAHTAAPPPALLNIAPASAYAHSAGMHTAASPAQYGPASAYTHSAWVHGPQCVCTRSHQLTYGPTAPVHKAPQHMHTRSYRPTQLNDTPGKEAAEGGPRRVGGRKTILFERRLDYEHNKLNILEKQTLTPRNLHNQKPGIKIFDITIQPVSGLGLSKV